MNIGLLECDHVDERLQSVAGGYPEMFRALLNPYLPELEFTRYDAAHGELPSSFDNCDAWLCTGSRAAVYDATPWIEALKAFVRSLRGSGRPYVGICFGHQLLAAAFGGTVQKSANGWGIGSLPVEVIEQRPWMEPPLATCRLHYMHQDQVTALPEGATLLARGEHCEVAVFTVDDSLLGIEGHPEFPMAYMAALLRERTERLGADRVQQALEGLVQLTDDAILARWIARFFSCTFPAAPDLSRHSC